MMEAQHSACVAIVIAAYNAAATIERAILSALAEPGVAEVVVVDDASVDNTADIVRQLASDDARVKVLQRESNRGPAAARNQAIAESTAPWIGVLDADDYFVPGRVQALLAFGEAADFVADNRWQVSDPRFDAPPLGEGVQPQTIDFRTFVSSNVTRRGQDRQELGFIKPLMRRAFLEKHKLHYREDMRLGEDFDLYARALAFKARMLILPERGYVSVVRAESLSGKHSIHELRQLGESNRALLRDFNLSSTERKALREHYRSVDCRLQWRLLIEAVKQRDLAGCLKTFLRPWPVPFYLAEQLLEQAYARSLRPKGAK